jgi:acetylornithine deacetylase/succinyl-diaminopimelate desuccinylase-like protein
VLGLRGSHAEYDIDGRPGTPPSSSEQAAPRDRPAELLRRLIRFDTTNPPGNERECVEWIGALLSDAGCETTILAKDPSRPNLLARLNGRGESRPLLLYGHVDVATVEGQTWQLPPFEGKLVDGWVWGRGALDMKGGVAMLLSAFLRAKMEELTPAGDILLLILSDEEMGGRYGAQYLVQEHPDMLDGVRFAIGEVGGFTFHVGGRRFYPIQVAEKQICRVRATLRGPGGYGALPVRGGTMAKLGRLLERLDVCRLPVHVMPAVQDMLETMADALPGEPGETLRRLLDPAHTDETLDRMGEASRLFDALLHNTVNATIVRGGGPKPEVIPSEVTVEMDGRLLPGYTPEDLLAELHEVVGSEVELEVSKYWPGPPDSDTTLLDLLSMILRKLDPEAVPVTWMLPVATDGRTLAALGIQTYGFLPMNLPPDFDFARTIHGADERVPAEALNFGADAIYEVLRRFGPT